MDGQRHLNYYILQKEFPHCIGVISSHPVETTLCQVEIPGYNMWVVFNYTLRGKVIPSYPDILVEIQRIVHEMAMWFLTERIEKEPKKFSKWRYKHPSTTSL